MNSYILNANEVINLLLELNTFLEESLDKKSDMVPFFEFKSYGDSFFVDFLGVCIFGQDFDNRHYDESTDTYEDFDKYLLRQAETLIKSLNEVNFKSFSEWQKSI